METQTTRLIRAATLHMETRWGILHMEALLATLHILTTIHLMETLIQIIIPHIKAPITIKIALATIFSTTIPWIILPWVCVLRMKREMRSC